MTDLPKKEATSKNPRVSTALRFLPPLLIVVGALFWYRSYWRCWFNPHDEGGTACLIAQRLLGGERLWVDVEPGYNIGWFYPIVWLFHFTGVNYLAARAWFFVLATFTALLGCGIITRISGSRWLGLAIGWTLVVLPGSQFKDYIPLAEAANTACLILMTCTNPASAKRWFGSIILGGLTLGVTLLIRVEIGYFFMVIWVGALLLFLLDGRTALRRRALCALAGIACLAGGIFVLITPTYFYCRSEGVQSEFLSVYINWARFLRHSLGDKSNTVSRPPYFEPHPQRDQHAFGEVSGAETRLEQDQQSSVPAAEQAVESTDASTLPRQPFSGIWLAKGRYRLLPFLTYAPILGFAVFLVLALVGLARDLWRRDFTLASAPMRWLLLIGGSLTTFPQFFLFRPDRPHLSEFMPGFIIAMAGGVWLLWARRGSGVAHRAGVWIISGSLAIHLVAFAVFVFEHPSGGTIAARKRRKTAFDAENGVNVFVTTREAQILTGVRDAVLRYSRPEDYLVCFPYMPGYNVMTNRRTYIRNVYVDNATRTSDWSDECIHAFETKRPAVVIIDDRRINGLEASRFSRWAAKSYAYLKRNYTCVARLDDDTIQVFALTSSALPVDSPHP